MAETTNIEWCDGTVNLWWGCTKVSNGCKFCYAEELSDKRYGNDAWGPGGTRKEVKSWRETLAKIAKRAKKEGRRLRVFCQSMSDTFEGPETMGGEDSENWKLVCRLRLELFDAIQRHPEIDFLILTKRPENVMRAIYHDKKVAETYFGGDESTRWWLNDWRLGSARSNVWIGTSVEDQKTADERIPELLKIPAKVRFLSCEPLLGEVDLSKWIGANGYCVNCGSPKGFAESHDNDNLLTACLNSECVAAHENCASVSYRKSIHWVIVGGESGPNARPMHPSWARSLRDQCVAAEVPFFFKQWGEWLPWMGFNDAGVEDELEFSRYQAAYLDDDDKWFIHYVDWQAALECPDDTLGRVGKKRAGRLLDGREWNQMPEVAN